MSDKNLNDLKINNPENNNDKTKEDTFGYDLYPERKSQYQPSVSGIIFKNEGTEYIDKIKCEKTVYSCIKNSPLVRLMMNALKSSGCPIDIRRHISCEVCHPSVSGGYDPSLNQVVICQNRVKEEGIVQGILTHEFIHMFDFCRHELDFKNIDHLACTEIRAANLTHCSFLSATSQGDASFFNIRKTHQDCVKTKALYSILAVRKISVEEAQEAIERVFSRCYADLEPIGRRIRRNSTDMFRAYEEAHLYGYKS